jgi:hypothetical protein
VVRGAWCVVRAGRSCSVVRGVWCAVCGESGCEVERDVVAGGLVGGAAPRPVPVPAPDVLRSQCLRAWFRAAALLPALPANKYCALPSALHSVPPPPPSRTPFSRCRFEDYKDCKVRTTRVVA